MFKIGVNTEYWYREDAPEESLRYIAECGIESIDYDICSLFDKTFDEETLTSFFDQDWEDLCKYYDRVNAAMEANNLVFSQWHGIFPIYYPNDAARTEYLLKMTDVMIALCAYTNCPAIVIHPWTSKVLTKKQEMDINFDLYRRLIRYLIYSPLQYMSSSICLLQHQKNRNQRHHYDYLVHEFL